MKTFAKISLGVGIVICVAILAGIFIIAVDIASGFFLYQSTFKGILNSGGVKNVYLAKTIAVVVSAIWYIAVPLLIFSFIKFQRTRAVAGIVALYASWFLLLYLFTYNSGDLIFNPITGQANYNYYKTTEGVVELFPADVKHHPILGVALPAVTTDVMGEFVAQNPGFKFEFNRLNKPGESKSGGVLKSLASNTLVDSGRSWRGGTVDYKYLDFYMERLSATNVGYIARFSCDNDGGYYRLPVSLNSEDLLATYLTDETGKKFKAESVTGEFENGVRTLAYQEKMIIEVLYGGTAQNNPYRIFFPSGSISIFE
ncbi:hypothetical protein IPM19_03710 [bacterium]|nr:MAG: hypothetical protein IPM19_03710 [bacterium]